MKFSTRARYGLRMMVELARLLEKEPVVHLGRIARITGLSENYLAQLAMSLKNNGLLLGISGKKGGYQLARPAAEIKIGDIIRSVAGPLSATDCVGHPEICLNSNFCEARALWVLVSDSVANVLNDYSLSDLIRKDWLADLRKQNPHNRLLYPDKFMADGNSENLPGCPMSSDNKRGE
jgi:Rrf2 family protein